jgi:hypothetical protein
VKIENPAVVVHMAVVFMEGRWLGISSDAGGAVATGALGAPPQFPSSFWP